MSLLSVCEGEEKEEHEMAKQKNKINVKQMSLEQLRTALVNASGKNKNMITNEINRRTK